MTPLILAAVAIASAAGVAIGRKLERQDSWSPDEGWIRNLIEYRVAVHEAGHAVCAWYSPYVTEITHITIDEGSIGNLTQKDVKRLLGPLSFRDGTVSIPEDT